MASTSPSRVRPRAAAACDLRTPTACCARAALAAARASLLLVALVAVGCASLRTRVLDAFAHGDLVLSFDRPSDLLPPEGLRVTSTQDRAVALVWEPVLVGDVAGYAITRAHLAPGPYEPVGIAHSRFGNVFVDAGERPGALGDAQTWHYRIHPFDSAGRVSRSHAYVTAVTDPAPSAPEGVQAYSNLPRRVVLRWSASESASATGYTIQRSPTAAGPWERVGYVDGRVRTQFEDSVAGDLRVLYYRMLALNRFGGESAPTEPVRAVTKAEPLPPIGLEIASRALGEIGLRWTPNVERDLVRYELWRESALEHGLGPEGVVGEVPPDTTQALDFGVGCGERVRYRLRAHDVDGLQSEFSAPLESVGEDMGLRASTGVGGSRLSWDAARARGWQSVRVFHTRSLRTDLLLGEAPVDGSLALGTLATGRYPLDVVLVRDASTRPAPPGVAFGSRPARGEETSPACRLELVVP